MLQSRPGMTVDLSQYVFLPTVTQGERELDWHAGSGASGPSSRHGADAGIGFGMGLTPHWYSELDLQFRRRSPSGTTFDGLEWENILQLAEPNEWPIDVGLSAELELPRDSHEGSSVLMGPLFQKEFEQFQANFNVLVRHHFGTSVYSANQVKYQSQFKYRYKRSFEFGLQAFGTLGSPPRGASEYSDGLHRIGPVVLGRFPLRRERSISYNAALLIGVTPNAFQHSLRLQVEYEF